ncbi:helix-turn-helix domain-containing protein [Salmonella enterica subsp. enterica serovar Derby]|uniref:Helix-turn-helix domain-containing protein n=4 Tax=Enterobacteriaceae TaxID=543 RepID=A0A383GHW6_ECOLX|nr:MULTISPECIES: helix-turn-helix domain-containing protein [Enterobacteriaceae]EAC1335983.1 XRE family transcriptional regulator [Salmonella enterica subsp. enterica serovar Typhimurium]EBC9741864.1 XRE family transcriptional regulator [Salmonella enterica subsp. enterica serovar Infantis]EBE0761038.1 bacteriophage CI repressor [Salmonella enterica subsp. enterica serovar Eko]EBE8988424.1 bacteriophage CI repressor [Salmonella enterica subsp. enterica serovar Chailey]EBF8696345.1 bacteriophag
MSKQTADDFSFSQNRKESIQDRIKQLVGTRSLRKATSDWGLPYSTINNYFEKGTTPGLNVVATIAKLENVSLEWLVYGESDRDPIIEKKVPTEDVNRPNTSIVDEILRRATPEDRERLIDMLCCIGIKGVLERLQQPTRQTKQADSELEEQRKAIQSLNIRQSLKDVVCMALAGDEENDKEILRRAKAIFCAGTPGDRVPVTPEQETKPVNKKSA